MESLGERIRKGVEEHARQTASFMNDYQEFDRLFRCIPKEKRSSSGYANTFVPETFRCVETVVSALDERIFGADPYLGVAPDYLLEADIESAAKSQALLEKYANGNSVWCAPLQDRMNPSLRSYVINGTCIGRVPWEYKERWVSEGADYVQKALYSAPGYVNVPLTRFHYGPMTAMEMSDCEWVAERYPSNKKAIKELISSIKNFPGAVTYELTDEDFEGTDSGGETAGADKAEQMREGKGYAAKEGKQPTVIDYWGKHPDREVEITFRIVLVNGKVAAEMPNPYRHGMLPYVKACLIEQEESFYGLGLGYVLKLPQIEMNDFRNLMRDKENFSLFAPMQSEGALVSIPHDRLKLEPMKVYPVSKYGRLTPLLTMINDLGMNMKLEELSKDDMRTTSGATAVQQASPTNVSAREISAMGNASDRRVYCMAKGFAGKMVRTTLWFWHEMFKQFHKDEEAVSIPGPNGEPTVVGVAGSRKTVDDLTGMISYSTDLMEEPQITIKVSTDGQGQQGMLRRVSSIMTTLADVVKVVPDLEVDFVTIGRELGRLLGVRPMSLIRRRPPPMLPAPAGEVAAPPELLAAPGETLPPMNPSGAVNPNTGLVSEGLPPVPPNTIGEGITPYA